MPKRKSPISEKYTNPKSVDISSVKKEIPWTHYVLDNFIKPDALHRFQKAIISKKHKFSIQENDAYQLKFALLKYLPLARVFYSIEFKFLLETLCNQSLFLNKECFVQLRYMNQDSPVFPKHIDAAEQRSLVALYYLSPNWSEEAGGQLCLYKNELEDENNATVINPIENRLVLFFTDETNWHSVRKVGNWDRYSILSEWIVKN